ncbi:uncharacterized protein LOC135091518 isoform X3 [Scylla paramamosain]|uniref:uncharacterized protein LOC135091518 isoform X3 n=1 Tax=Scylla paramamosain TaxID=85552 RepID=UPI00308273DE
MIYVFPIDTGTLMTFDMNLALESPQSAGCAPLAVTSVPLEDLCQAPLDLHPSPWRVSRVASVCCGGQQQQQHSSLHPCDHSPQY